MKKTKLIASAIIFAGIVGTQGALAGSKMVAYTIKDNSIAQSLTNKKGDPAKGRKLAANRKKGNCLACHATKDLKEFDFHGHLGPALDGASARYSEGELRLRLVDAKKLNEDTMMPAFYKNSGLTRVKKKFVGKSILTAQELEDVLAYLMTLK